MKKKQEAYYQNLKKKVNKQLKSNFSLINISLSLKKFRKIIAKFRKIIRKFKKIIIARILKTIVVCMILINYQLMKIKNYLRKVKS